MLDFDPIGVEIQIVIEIEIAPYRKHAWQSINPMRDTLLTLYRAFQLIVHASPATFWRVTVLDMVAGAGTPVLLWLGKVVIDYIAVTAPHTLSFGAWLTATPPYILGAVIAFIVINLALDSVEALSSLQGSLLSDQIEIALQRRLLAKVGGFESIAVFEDPALLNLLVLAEGSAGKLQWLAKDLSNWTIGIFMALPTLVVAATIAWWVPVVIFLTALPTAYFQFVYERRTWDVQAGQAATVRKMRAQTESLVRASFAKELRMYGLRGYFLGNWQRLAEGRFSALQTIRRESTYSVLLWSLLSGLTAGLVYLFVVFQAVQGRFTLGDVALFVGLIYQVRRSLVIIIWNMSTVQEIALNARALFELLDYDESRVTEAQVSVPSSGRASPPTASASPSITVADLSFIYPGAAQPALRGVNLHIAPGETVVIVGENGGGKSTLAKLLCRLYAPSSGTILWNGDDYRYLNLDHFRQQIAVLFQDFARFPATLRENIGFGDLDALHDDERLRRAASQIGVGRIAETLPRQLDTPLNKELEDGVELSGGQWQRVAIARALMRSDVPLVILDEPTAALDPRTEHEALSLFRRMAEGKTAVIISHRLALARIATTVVVMENGQIVERGTHDDLMEAGGLYAEMFTRQASSYVDPPDEGSRD